MRASEEQDGEGGVREIIESDQCEKENGLESGCLCYSELLHCPLGLSAKEAFLK